MNSISPIPLSLARRATRWLAGLLTFCAPAASLAVERVSTNDYVVAAGQTIRKETWVAAQNATVAGRARDALFLLAGGNVDLSGRFDRDVWAFGDLLTVTGRVDQTLRLMGRAVHVGGTVGGNLESAGDVLAIDPGTTVSGDVLLVGNAIVLEGCVRGDATIFASRTLTIAGRIAGNAHVVAPNIVFQDGAKIDGDFDYVSPDPLLSAGDRVGGKVRHLEPPAKRPSAGWLFSSLLVGLPFLSVFPFWSGRAIERLRTGPWRCLWVGSLLAILLPMLGMLCLPAPNGAPLGLLLLGGWLALAYLGRIVTALALGMLLIRRRPPGFFGILLALSVGLLALYLVGLAPVLALPVQIAAATYGMGALVLAGRPRPPDA